MLVFFLVVAPFAISQDSGDSLHQQMHAAIRSSDRGFEFPTELVEKHVRIGMPRDSVRWFMRISGYRLQEIGNDVGGELSPRQQNIDSFVRTDGFLFATVYHINVGYLDGRVDGVFARVAARPFL